MNRVVSGVRRSQPSSALDGRCGVCGTIEYRRIHTMRQRSLAGDPYEIVLCESCNLVRTHPSPSAAELAAVYGEAYYSYGQKLVDPGRFGPLKASLKMRLLRHNLHALYPYALSPRPQTPSVRLLDIGCGSGRYLAILRQAKPDWLLHGVEPHPPSARLAASRAGCEVRASDLLGANWPASSFDAVCFWDVFEHLGNPLEVARETRRILAPGGYAYFLLPNFESFWSRRFGASWWQLLVPQHLYHYTPRTLSALLTSTGLDVKRIEFPRQRVNVLWNAANWVRSVKESGADLKLKVRIIERLAGFAVPFDRARLLPSASLYLAARRPA